jgi:predicted glycosyltransferase
MAQRLMFYSHDTYGLGHIRRTQKIAHSLARSGRSILVLCSSRWLSRSRPRQESST